MAREGIPQPPNLPVGLVRNGGESLADGLKMGLPGAFFRHTDPITMYVADIRTDWLRRFHHDRQ
jgi:hypothetical protein